MIPLIRGLLRVCVVSRFSCVQLFAMLLTIAHQHPLSTGFSRQEYWIAVPFLHGISRSRDQTRNSCGSCTASRFFTAEPRSPQSYQIHRDRTYNSCQGLREMKMGSYCSMGTEFQFYTMKKTQRQILLMVAQQCEYT